MQLDKIIIIIGPSAVGKTTIARGLLKTSVNVGKVTTTTTRAKRPSETEGEDYYFISKPEFEELITQNGLLEWAKYNGNYYGSRISDIDPILKAGKIPMWVTESKGAEFFKLHYPHAITIFIMPASFETLRKRLEKRNLPKDEIVSRLKIAKQELLNAPKADYRVINYDGKVGFVINETAEIIRKHFGLSV